MRLKVIEIVGKDKGENILAECLCECGNRCVTRLSRAVSGETKSCGCLIKKSITTHGGSKDRRYETAKGIYKRCHNDKSKFYYRYGGRGITSPDSVSKIYEMLLSVEGYFDGAEIDRINNDGNYEFGNLRWVTRTENMRNTSRTTKEKDYETKPINRANFKRFCNRIGSRFEDYEEKYTGFRVGVNKMYNYKKIELRVAKEAK